jgi:hypothetical protein
MPKVDKLEGDLVWGIKGIAAAIGQSRNATYYMLSRGLLPAGQQGERWVASKRELKAYFAQLTSQKARAATSTEAA